MNSHGDGHKINAGYNEPEQISTEILLASHTPFLLTNIPSLPPFDITAVYSRLQSSDMVTYQE